MSLFRPYTSEFFVHNYPLADLTDLDNVEALTRLFQDNVTRFLGIPRSLHVPDIEIQPEEEAAPC